MKVPQVPPEFDWTDGLAAMAVVLWILMVAAMIAYAMSVAARA